MDAQQHAATKPSPPPSTSGIRTVLKYTGIPASWLAKRPKLPSRNWLIFLSTTASLAGLYVYDRTESRRIRQAYIDRVKHLAEQSVPALDAPRRVTVYGSKWPGDEDYDQSLKHFRKYIKPILVAAAVDYDMVAGKRHGELARRIANDIRLRRRRDLGLDPVPPATTALPTYKPPAEARQHELRGGIVLIGRPTFKEFMAGLQAGWTQPLHAVDHDELLARELESDPHFDELDEEPPAEPRPPLLPPPLQPPVFSPPPSLDALHAPPPSIPLVPPLLLVSFIDHIGFAQIPHMLWDFFNQRHKVRAGAEAAYRLIMAHTRPFVGPPPSPDPLTSPSPPAPHVADHDLDFDKPAETYYTRATASLPDTIDKARTQYYAALPARLATARALARGMRPPTADERERPPPTEVELRAERLEKERRWRRDVAGWDIVRPAQGVAWDERFRGALQVFDDPPAAGESGCTWLD